MGVGVFILNDKKQVLLLKRNSSHGAGMWGGTGGHLEHLESFAGCAKRETMEEAGIEIDNVRFLCVSNLHQYAPKHFVDIGLIADYVSGEPRIMEPHKHEEIGWFDIDNPPSPLFAAQASYFEAYKSGQQYFDV